MKRPKHYDDYADMNEVAPGVFVSPGDGVYLVDDIGEVVCWVATEMEDPEAFTAAVSAVALAASKGVGEVRKKLRHLRRLQ